MLLPEKKEREYRFSLALRMALPIFLLLVLFIYNTFQSYYESLDITFYFNSVLLLAFSIYFIFFLIYDGFSVQITEPISKTFTRSYLYKYLKKEIKKNKEYTLILISIDNLYYINETYGFQNGDKVLSKFVQYIEKYFNDKQISNFPMGQLKGGDFIIGLPGESTQYKTILELLCLKSNEILIDHMEVKISGAIIDTLYSDKLDFLFDKLFDNQMLNKQKKYLKEEDIDPNDLESYTIDAIENRSFIIKKQAVFENNSLLFYECFVKMKTSNGKVLHPKSYMKVVHKLGLSAEYDFILIEKICEIISSQKNISLCLNIEASSIRNYSFVERLNHLLTSNEIVKNKLLFLIAESQYYSNITRYNSTLQSIRKMGIKVGIDRVGSLHTSFLYMRDLDIDFIRFDSIYSKKSDKMKYKNILKGFNTTAHNLGLKTWIKMIEDNEIGTFVNDLGIDYKQGKSLSELEDLYEEK